jgi:hypothetical protein
MIDQGIYPMSSLTKALEKRIHDLKLSIESQQAELAAYEKVLELERATPGQSHQMEATEDAHTDAGIVHSARPQLSTDELAASGTRNASTVITEDPELSGSKGDFVAAIARAHGASGATPKDVGQAFSARRIKRSKNLIYNALSSLVKQKKLERREGRYFFLSADSGPKAVVPKKRKFSAEGLERIREANKKRWAREQSARGARAKSAAKKSTRPTKKVRTKRAAKKTAA